ncbi:radical SAM protein [Kitasatospora brasiliensis]|uniref:radical SAM protein n=1 Tax=Kitasatospora brasiliensis TaxID=3058040 RepID=UPI00292F61AC|nr:radical SAM protein [Kitasatospora sp. K002]
MREKPISLLWGLRSHCASHGCLYCYFGTDDEHREQVPTRLGVLSHLSPNDLTTDQVLEFAATLADSPVGRVFLAGGEPLLWKPINRLIGILKAGGLEVVVCTSGVALNRPEIREPLIELGVDAVSVSLDSADPVHNDRWRPPRREGDGWEAVVSGIIALIEARGSAPRPKVGIYSVITRRNLADIVAVPELAAGLGCDYAVPQPIALDTGHRLSAILSLTSDLLPELTARFDDLYAADLPLVLPERAYADQVASAVRRPTDLVPGCFGGDTLYFVQPDGTVWDCPSGLKIAATPPQRHRSLKGATARELFRAPTGCGNDCALFSVDCVNMWPLAGFPALASTGQEASRA